ncbi:hypothetical protein [Pigmentiphaga daeguensis]|uniref:Uncharacterized protein n=1 Tax=Pigmentiphaga daeguensis TaxID=414049 RepID=A0ABN1BSK1_9BURK
MNKPFQVTEKHLDFVLEIATKTTMAWATETLKSLVLVNGGALVAVLTYVATKANDGRILAPVASWFGLGIVTAIIAMGLLYHSNAAALTSTVRTAFHGRPYRLEEKYRRMGVAAKWLAWISLGLFGAGLVHGYCKLLTIV